MNSYKIGSPCSACGERGASSKYCNGWPESNRWFDLPFGGPPDDFEPTPFITRECKNCGYRWNEAPINN